MWRRNRAEPLPARPRWVYATYLATPHTDKNVLQHILIKMPSRSRFGPASSRA
jgi:hypothetical protein